MSEKEGYGIESIYQGSVSSLDPGYGELFMGGTYRVPTGELGSPTSIQTANQIKEVSQRLNEGVRPIELQPIKAEVFDQIPKQQFKEIRQLSKLTGATMSLHAPIIEPSGVGEQGWSEMNRELAERQIRDAVFRAAELSDDERVSVTIHASATMGSEFAMKGKGADRKKVQDKIVLVDNDTGKLVSIAEETERYRPYMEKLATEGGKIDSAESQIGVMNHSQWNESVSKVVFNKENADRILETTWPYAEKIYNKMAQAQHEKKKIELTPTEQDILMRTESAKEYLDHSKLVADGLFEKAYKIAKNENDQKEMDKLNKIAKEFREISGQSDKYNKAYFEQHPEEYVEYVSKQGNIKNQSYAVQKLIEGLSVLEPNLLIPLETYTIKKSAETFGNVAFDTYEKFKDKGNLPMINIENLPMGMAYSTGEQMKELVEASRKKFEEKAKSKGYSNSEAEKAAEKMIGMTFDVGHLNIARKKGFETEDMQKELEQISKYVKHVHLTDNFGYSDSHLAPGMGNVPTKEFLQELNKAGFKGNKIVEAGAFVQHFGVSPMPYALDTLGSPMSTVYNSPYWNQAPGLYQGYSEGFGMILPQTNYKTFGAGFSQLPRELGGSAGGAEGSRMSGKPME